VPLFWAWHDAGPGRAALYGFAAGVAFFSILLSWTVYFGAVAVIPLVLAQAAYWAGAGAIVGLLQKWRVQSPLVVTAAWVVMEALRVRWPLGGFPWGQVGAALHGFDAAHALASWGGIPLASFFVVLGNALLVELWFARGKPLRALVVPLAALALVVVLVVGAVAFRFDPTPTGHFRYALLQGNDQDRRLTQAEIDSGYLEHKHLALAATLRGEYDLIVFPESSVEDDPESDPQLKAEILALARRHNSAVMVNVIDDQHPPKVYNANRLYEPDGHLQGTYAKQHLVPFGEYVPWRHELRFISELQQVPTDFDPGHTTKVFDVKGTPVGTVICFESAFGPLMRASVRKGAQVITVTTNNRSYRRSANSAQHVALSQMNAAAVGRPVLHASVSGITAVINASGKVEQRTTLFHNAVTTGSVTTTTGQTPYVRWGAWVDWISLVVLAGGAVLGLRRRRLGGSGLREEGSDS
jgi:apolipoprotein N-acyltransferase